MDSRLAQYCCVADPDFRSREAQDMTIHMEKREAQDLVELRHDTGAGCTRYDRLHATLEATAADCTHCCPSLEPLLAPSLLRGLCRCEGDFLNY